MTESNFLMDTVNRPCYPTHWELWHTFTGASQRKSVQYKQYKQYNTYLTVIYWIIYNYCMSGNLISYDAMSLYTTSTQFECLIELVPFIHYTIVLIATIYTVSENSLHTLTLCYM